MYLIKHEFVPKLKKGSQGPMMQKYSICELAVIVQSVRSVVVESLFYSLYI